MAELDSAADRRIDRRRRRELLLDLDRQLSDCPRSRPAVPDAARHGRPRLGTALRHRRPTRGARSSRLLPFRRWRVRSRLGRDGDARPPPLAGGPCDPQQPDSRLSEARRNRGLQCLHRGLRIPAPVDHAAIARACGIDGVRVERAEDFLPALQRAIGLGRAALIDVVTDPTAHPPITSFGDRFDSPF